MSPKTTNPKPPKSTADLDAFSIPEFCRRHAISRSTYYNLKKLKPPKGPRETRIQRRIVVTRANAAAWLKKQDEESA